MESTNEFAHMVVQPTVESQLFPLQDRVATVIKNSFSNERNPFGSDIVP
jgi:hypothetical protein